LAVMPFKAPTHRKRPTTNQGSNDKSELQRTRPPSARSVLSMPPEATPYCCPGPKRHCNFGSALTDLPAQRLLIQSERPGDRATGVDHQPHGVVFVLRREPPTCASDNEHPQAESHIPGSFHTETWEPTVRSIMNPDKLAHLGHPLSPLATHAPGLGAAWFWLSAAERCAVWVLQRWREGQRTQAARPIERRVAVRKSLGLTPISPQASRDRALTR
jgi:hypothetical protein